MARAFFFQTILSCLLVVAASPKARAQSVTIGGVTFASLGLVGVGRVPASQRDKLGETFGSLSGLSLDAHSWRRNADGSYSGTLYAQPDRGHSPNGTTTNYRPRFNKFTLTFTPATNSSFTQTQLALSLSDTTLFMEADGTPLTSLDPTVTGSGTRVGFPPLPQAFNRRISIDAEGIVLLGDGTFFVSDEYGPYLYHFAADGKLLGAIRPPEALIPKRGGQDSFSSDNPANNQPSPSPNEPTSGRENNQGFEGLTLSADGQTLYALMQSATRQDGGAGGNSQRRHARLLAYDITNPSAATLKGEWILPLPLYNAGGSPQIASQGDLVALSSRQFLVLTRDGNGRGGDAPVSLYRAVLVYDIGNATNLAGSTYDSPATPAAPGGILAPGIVPATSAVLLDLNDAGQLSKFGLSNGPLDSNNNLAGKWESLALAPALDPAAPDDFFLFIGNDNDFSTTDGFQDGASYRSALNIDTMVLVYRVSLATRLVNISSRSQTGPNDAAHIVGFVVHGARTRAFLIRGVGPGLVPFGVPGVLPDPVLQIFDSAGRPILANDNWGDAAGLAELRAVTGAVSAFALPEGSRDAALIAYLDPGSYTVQVTDAAGRTGISLAEVYEVP